MASQMSSGENRPIQRRSLLKLTGSTIAVGTFAGCLGDDDDDDDDIDPDDTDDVDDDVDEDPITIAGLQPYSGPFALYGDMHTAGVEFAIEEINQDGGVLGRQLEHQAVDTGSDPGEALTIFTGMVEDHDPVSIVGPVSSDVVLNVVPDAEDLEIPLFIHAGGDPREITRESRFTFRTANLPAPVWAQSFAQLIEEEGYDSAGAIIADYAWGRAMEASLEYYLEDEIDLHMEVASFGEEDFTPYLIDFPEDVELLIGSGHPPGVHPIFSQALELGMEPELYVAAIAPTTASIGALGESVTQNFSTGTQPDMFSDEFIETAERFHDATGEQFDSSSATGYATVQMIAEAIEEADSADSSDVGEMIRTQEFDTLFAEPMQYTEYGEPDQQVHILSGYEMGDTPYPPETEIRPTEVFRSEPLPARDPDEDPFEIE